MCLIKAPPFRRCFFSICAFFFRDSDMIFDTFFRVIFFLQTVFFSLWKVKPSERSSVVGFGDVAFGEDFLSAFLNWRPEFHAEVEVLLDELKRSYMSTIWESRNVRNAAETAAFLGKKEPCFPKIQHGGAWKSIFGLLKLPEKGYFTLHMLRFQLKALHNRCVSCIERAGVQKSSSRRCHWKSRVQITSPAVRAQSDKCWIVFGQHLWLHPSIRKKLSFRVLSFVLCIQMDSATTTSWPSMVVFNCSVLPATPAGICWTATPSMVVVVLGVTFLCFCRLQRQKWMSYLDWILSDSKRSFLWILRDCRFVPYTLSETFAATDGTFRRISSWHHACFTSANGPPKVAPWCALSPCLSRKVF